MSTNEGDAGSAAGSLAARVALAGGLMAPVCAVLGPALANGGVMTGFAGFRFFLMSLPLALIGLLAGGVALVRTRKEQNVGVRRRALTGQVASVLTISAIIGLVLPTIGLPIINDITTDIDNPPKFVHAATLPGNGGVDLTYKKEFAPQQADAYPSIEPLDLDMPTSEAFERALRALDSLPNAEITESDPKKGRIEGIVTSRIFGFVDDVVIRVRRHGTGSRIDIRSRSRVGHGDMGANAARIELLIAAIR